MNATLPLAYRVVGPLSGVRHVVVATAAFAGYAACDPRANVDREGHLSVFSFGPDFQHWLEGTGSTKGFDGLCWAAWIWFDLDRQGNLDGALQDANRLTEAIHRDFGVPEPAMLALFSGAKGLHIGLPTSLWCPPSSLMFDRIARRFAEEIAARAGVTIDKGIYHKTASLRAPNSRHPKSGRHKRHIELRDLARLTGDDLLDRAAKPAPFDFPRVDCRNDLLKECWDAAHVAVESSDLTLALGQGKSRSRLNRLTMDFICSGGIDVDSGSRLFSAAANLGEFGCPGDLAHALLFEAARDRGLSPSEILHHINSGLRRGMNRPPAKEPTS
jgi:hypothetical protein